MSTAVCRGCPVLGLFHFRHCPSCTCTQKEKQKNTTLHLKQPTSNNSNEKKKKQACLEILLRFQIQNQFSREFPFNSFSMLELILRKNTMIQTCYKNWIHGCYLDFSSPEPHNRGVVGDHDHQQQMMMIPFDGGAFAFLWLCDFETNRKHSSLQFYQTF